MEGLTAWVKQVILIALLAGLVEMIMPDSISRRYTQVALGLLVMLSILLPFLQFLQQDIDWETALAFSGQEARPALALPGEVERFKANERRMVLEVYSGRLARRAREAAAGVDGVRDVRISVQVETDPRSPRYGSVLGATVEGWLNDKTQQSIQATSDSIADTVGRVLGLERERVSVVIKG